MAVSNHERTIRKERIEGSSRNFACFDQKREYKGQFNLPAEPAEDDGGIHPTFEDVREQGWVAFPINAAYAKNVDKEEGEAKRTLTYFDIKKYLDMDNSAEITGFTEADFVEASDD